MGLEEHSPQLCRKMCRIRNSKLLFLHSNLYDDAEQIIFKWMLHNNARFLVHSKISALNIMESHEE
jgi:hypothetical protein